MTRHVVLSDGRRFYPARIVAHIPRETSNAWARFVTGDKNARGVGGLTVEIEPG